MATLVHRLFQRFSHGRAIPLPLSYTLDMDANGNHTVAVFADLPEGREKVTNIRSLAEYGYSLERNGRTYKPSVSDIERLLSLGSLNPDMNSSGDMVFEMTPPVLSYLRQQPTITEQPASKQLAILKQPLKPTIRVDFSPQDGATVDAGYATAGSTLVSLDKLPRTRDGGYVRLGDAFAPLSTLPSQVQSLIDRGTSKIPLKDVPEFFARDLLAMRLAAQPILTPAANAVQVVDDVPPAKVTLDAGTRGWLDFDVSYGNGSGAVSLSRAAGAAKRGESFVQVTPSTFQRIDPRAVLEIEQRVMQIGAEETLTGYRVPAQRIGTLQDVVAKIGGASEVTAAYQRFLAELTGLQLDPNAKLPTEIEQALDGLGFELRPYQRQGIQWLRWLAENGLHGLLADDMGLGKTAQTILAMRADYLTHPNDPPHSLVVCPNSVVEGWKREIQRLFPTITIDIHLGDNRSLRKFESTSPRIFISSYATLARDAKSLGGVAFRYLVLDEASHIKNPASQRTRAMKQINALRRLCLTGTPVENRPAELWSLMDFLLPGHLGEHGTFARRFENPIMSGDENAAAQLARRISPFLLRRLKQDVAKDLPEKVDLKKWCNLTAEQVALYRQVLAGAHSSVDALKRGEQVSFTTNILPILSKLQQVCDHPAMLDDLSNPVLDDRSEKFDLAIEIIEDVAEAGEKVIVFSHFLRMLDLLGVALSARGIGFVRIDGSTATGMRQELVDRISQNKAFTVALCSLQATGYGINLQAANHVIHIDRWWNPAVEDQATARAHRIGQTKTVFVHRPLLKGTLEERIDALLDKKRGIADDVIGGASTGQKSWTIKEILEVLSPLDEVPD